VGRSTPEFGSTIGHRHGLVSATRRASLEEGSGARAVP
jgi:hypothetical protein